MIMMIFSVRRSNLVQLIKKVHESCDLHKIENKVERMHNSMGRTID